MHRPALVGGLALAIVVTGVVAPAAADTPAKDPAGSYGRFTRLDVSALKSLKIESPAAKAARSVTALVEVSGDPAVVLQEQAAAAGSTLSDSAARAQVVADQDKVLPGIRAAGARVDGRLTTVVNAVRVRVSAAGLDTIAAMPGVRRVQVSRPVSRDNGPTATYLGAPAAWQSVGVTGQGQKIAVIDTGIDYTHADFGGAGTAAAFTSNDGTVIEPGTFPTAKVVGGYDFVGDHYNADDTSPAFDPVPKPDPDPIDCEGHGTHVAGTAAGQGVLADGSTFTGPYDSSTPSRSFTVSPGMAPQASLLAYRVFGCEGSVNDDIVVAAIDRAAADGATVINMSLGSAFGTADGIEATAIDNATRAGTLVVTSAGNEGPGAYLVGGPSTTSSALSVAAQDASAATLPGVDVSGAFTGTLQLSNDATVTSLTAPLFYVGGLGCAAGDYAGAAGKIAVTLRGTCARVDRATLGQAAGAVAVIMANNAAGLPPTEGPIAGVTIPFLGATQAQGDALVAADGGTVTLTGGTTLPNPAFTNTASFSSNGPRRLDSAPKPDVTAPGVAVLSAAVGTGNGALTESGTSMASPATAGVAALVRQSHPTWKPLQIKAALQSTADPGAVGDFEAVRNGTGSVSAVGATSTVAYAWTRDHLNALAFGQREANGAFSTTRSLNITNRGRTSITYDLSAQLSSADLGQAISVSPRSVTVRAGRTETVEVRISFSRAAVAALPGASASDGGALVSLHGLIVATPRSASTGVRTLRTAFLEVVTPLSAVDAKRTKTGFTVRNTGVHPGDADVYAWQISDPSGDTADPEVADVVSAGVQSFPVSATDQLLVFAVGQARGTSTQATHEVDVTIDTNRDGKPDFLTFAADFGAVTAGSPDGTLGAFTVDLATGDLVDVFSAVGPMNGSTVLIPVLASDLGLTAADGDFDWTATGFTILDTSLPGDDTATATYDPFHPVVESGQFETLAPGASAAITAAVDTTQLGTQTAKGWLVVTPDDAAGRDEVTRVPLR